MQHTPRSTVERLDKPSAYYANKSHKRRRTDSGYRGDRGEGDDTKDQQQEAQQPEDEVDLLKDATTLYVGNL